jgi:hypothetical protein
MLLIGRFSLFRTKTGQCRQPLPGGHWHPATKKVLMMMVTLTVTVSCLTHSHACFPPLAFHVRGISKLRGWPGEVLMSAEEEEEKKEEEGKDLRRGERVVIGQCDPISEQRAEKRVTQVRGARPAAMGRTKCILEAEQRQ